MADVTRLLAQAQQQVEARQFGAARQTLTRALASDASSAHANDLMGFVLCELGQQGAALFYAQRAAELAPENPGVLADLGGLLSNLGRYAEGLAQAERALALQPGFQRAFVTKVAALLLMGRVAEARDAAALGLGRNAGDEELVERLAACEMDLAMPEAALARLRSLRLSGASTNIKLSEYQATLANYASVAADGTSPLAAGWVTPLQVLQMHKAVGQVLASVPVAPVTASEPRAAEVMVAGVRSARGSGPVRVAVLSADFRRHSVVRFFEPLARHLDAKRVELVGVMLSPTEDDYTARLRPRFAAYRNLGGAQHTPDDAAAFVRAQRCDVAIDLGGLMGVRGLLALRSRPAPVQVTYLGYPNTSGCGFIDRRVVDAITDPPELERLSVERLARTPGCFLCYQPPDDLPVARARDASRPVTFGCFSVIQKLSEQTVRLWARVLAAVPGARLVVKSSTLDDAATRRFVLERWRGLGLDVDRVTIRPYDAGFAGHLDSYHEVDVGLDPTPYNGTTSTCDALAMGTPVLAMLGPVHAARVSASILTHSGLGELVCASEEALVAKAAALAGDRAGLTALHARVRERFLGGPVCDGPKFAEGFAGLLEEMVGLRA